MIDNQEQTFSEIMYDRMLWLIQMVERGMFDLSEYEEMFERARSCNYEDKTIGIIQMKSGIHGMNEEIYYDDLS